MKKITICAWKDGWKRTDIAKVIPHFDGNELYISERTFRSLERKADGAQFFASTPHVYWIDEIGIGLIEPYLYVHDESGNAVAAL